MAHMVETMAYAGEVPWHGLGVPVTNDLTPVEMMEKAGVDWKVHEVESFVEFEGKRIKTGEKSLVRGSDHRVLTNVGPGWHSVQNEEAFEFFGEWVKTGDMEMHTAGSLKDGQIVWVLAKVKDSFTILGGDKVDSYFLFVNPHEYGKALEVRFTPIRVVCNNTLTLSLSKVAENGVKLSHRMAFDPDMVKEMLGVASSKMETYKEYAEILAGKQVTVDGLIEYYNNVFPRTSNKKHEGMPLDFNTLSKNAKTCFANFETQPGNEFAPGSWWQAFNSVTYTTDHIQGRNADNRLYSQWVGQNQARKVKALETALEMAA
jgi:phage/plasmid-like protein (TIGR03299 family)